MGEHAPDRGIPFVKMHGLGNDYVFIDAHEVAVPDPPAMSRRVSDRRRGIGSDGLILLLPPEADGDIRMRMFNADGSEAEMCGNGIRCLVAMAVDRGRVAPDARRVRVETLAGLREAFVEDAGAGPVSRITVDMGSPSFGPAAVGADPAGLLAIGPGEDEAAARGLHPAVAGDPDAEARRWWLVSMGNPHAVAFVPDAEAVDLHAIGPAVERHRAFPARINAHLASVLAPDAILMRTWERGSGPTDACGTGACAVAAAAIRAGLVERRVRVRLPGGELLIDWPEGRSVRMTGPAVESFHGVLSPG
ncbi:MAG: diaminopimelate epimerase [Planctomycetota bacterium]|jgi:diaminopimelate epimerase